MNDAAGEQEGTGDAGERGEDGGDDGALQAGGEGCFVAAQGNPDVDPAQMGAGEFDPGTAGEDALAAEFGDGDGRCGRRFLRRPLGAGGAAFPSVPGEDEAGLGGETGRDKDVIEVR